jgi:uncharacterized C2H2 Zn-finger protein
MSQKPRVVYNCELCLYLTNNKKDYIRHLETRKHQQYETETDNGNHANGTNKTTQCPTCNKVFKSRTSIYKHKLICRNAQPVEISETPDLSSLSADEQIKRLLLENKTLRELLAKTGGSGGGGNSGSTTYTMNL